VDHLALALGGRPAASIARHGRIICDLERRKTIALLPDREPATAQAWLTGQPQIAVVARDRVAATRWCAESAPAVNPSRRSLAFDGNRQPRLPRCGAQINFASRLTLFATDSRHVVRERSDYGPPPRHLDIDRTSDQDIQEIVLTTNLTPRKCLGFKTPCLDGAPWSRVALEVLRTSRERSCLRPFDADEMAPLALMTRPPGSSPPSFQRARSGAGVLSGFQAFAVGSHHFVGALDLQPRLAATIPLAEPVAVVRPQLAGRRIGRPSSSARR
jgi:hypothetical protein